MFYAFRCATMDIITEHCFQSSSDCLDSQDFKAPLLMDIQAGVPLLWTLKSFPWILPVIPILPNCIGGNLLNQYRALGDVQSFVANRVLPLRQRHQVAQVTHLTSQHSSDKGRATSVYHQLLEQVPTLDDVRLIHEGLSLIQAGSDTVANTCVVGFFHILNNPAVHAKLVHDLKAAWPDANTRLSWAELEKIPYLVRPFHPSGRCTIFILMLTSRVLLSKNHSE
jgi:putative lipoic acid-binding regulatory protein